MPAASRDAPAGRIAVRHVSPSPGAGAALIAAPGPVSPRPRRRRRALRRWAVPIPRRRSPGASPTRRSRASSAAASASTPSGCSGISGPEEAVAAPTRATSGGPPTRASASGQASPCTPCWSGARATAGPSPGPTAPLPRCASRGSAPPRRRSSRAARLELVAALARPRLCAPSSKALASAPRSLRPLGRRHPGPRLHRPARRADGAGEPGRVLVVDYKTDRLRGRSPRRPPPATASSATSTPSQPPARGTEVETVYVFLEQPGDPIRTVGTEPELDAARTRIEALLDRLAAGDFPVTHHPHSALCHDCPAASACAATRSPTRCEIDPSHRSIQPLRRHRPHTPAGEAEEVGADARQLQPPGPR